MSNLKQVRRERESFLYNYGKHPQAEEMVVRYESLADNPAYLRHLNNMLAYRTGLDPIPNRAEHDALLRAVGHDFAAFQALPPGGPLRNLFGSGPPQGYYISLQALIAARLMEKPAPLSERQIMIMYDTLDRMLRGGGSWPEVKTVPTVTFKDYNRLRPMRFERVVHPTLLLRRILEFKVVLTHGREYKPLFIVFAGALDLLAFAVAARNERQRVSTDDSFEAADAYAKLFEIDPMALPPLVREGKSGYEQVG